MSDSQGPANERPTSSRPLISSTPLDWKSLLTTIGPSLDARKLILASLGILMTWAGFMALDLPFRKVRDVAPFAPSIEIGRGPLPGALIVPRQMQDRFNPREWNRNIRLPGKPSLPGDKDVNLVDSLHESAGLAIEPVSTITKPFRALFSLEPGALPFLHSVLGTIWVVFVWGLIGGAIARNAVVEASGGERIGVMTSIRFARSKQFSLTFAPFFPLGVIVLCALACGLLGLLYRIPGPIGATIAGVLLFLPLIAGILIALILLGLFLSWPLMILTVAAEGEDVFDAVSRGYAFATRRIARYAFYLAIAWIVGTIGLIFTTFLARLAVHFAEWSLSWGASVERLSVPFNRFAQDDSTSPSNGIHHAWLWLVGLIAHAWIYSYFWTAFARIYLLLRFEIDGTPTHDVYHPSHEGDVFAPEKAGGET